MIDIINKKKNINSIIIFIHGFKGGKSTWVKKDKKTPFIDKIMYDDDIENNYDVGIFSYHTQLLNFFPKTKNFFRKYILKKRNAINASIDEISKVLETDLKYHCRKYETIILIAHSMGGLVAKRFVLNDLKANTKTKVKLYISLATPHSGADLALLGSKLIDNCHVNDMTPLSNNINKLNDEWVQCNNLPKRIYAQGTSDKIVSKNSSIALDRERQNVIYTEDDHFSIIRGEKSNDSIIIALNEELKDILRAEKKDLHNILSMVIKDVTKLNTIDAEVFYRFKELLADEEVINKLNIYFNFKRKRGNINELEDFVKESKIIFELNKYLN